MATIENMALAFQAINGFSNVRRDLWNNLVGYKAAYQAGQMALVQLEAAVNGDGVQLNKTLDRIAAVAQDAGKKAKVLDGLAVYGINEAAVTAEFTELRAAANQMEAATFPNAAAIDTAIAWVQNNVTFYERLW